MRLNVLTIWLIPLFALILAIPFFGIIGWDITISDEGKVVIIEYNPDPDMRIEQLPFRDSCLMDYQDEILEEVYGIQCNK